ncbi:hypothetical protein JYU34_015619 [Plutella xylostella]|uniref:Facilitated trehalose transporter Tret1-like n=1 Tax=Plutella xylostella TaxID=51655 RepID=A0ABQ7Q832_PLUXY|nr:hypothetical protein JYU34_015619 [Plutella xylostella]
MEIFKSPVVNQALVAVGVLSTMLSCGLSLGYTAAYMDSQKTTDDVLPDGLKTIETCGEFAFIPAIIFIPVTMQRKGRRIASYATTVPLLLSWIISYYSNNQAVLLVNSLQNFALGGAVSTSSVTISEYCSPQSRGAILMLETAMISLGVLISHVFGMYSHWRLISFLGFVSSFTALFASLFWLESPYWLVSEGQIMRGTETFYWLRGFSDEACKELDAVQMLHKVKSQMQALKPVKRMHLRQQIKDFIKSLLNADFLRPLSIMILLFSFVGFGGENVTASSSYHDVFKLTYGKYIGTIILDVLSLVCSLIACVLIHIVRRKTLFIFTGSCSLVFLAVTSLVLFLQTFDMFSQEYVWLILTFSTGFAMFMSLGTTALPLSLLGEMFPMSYKGVGCSLTCAYLWAFGKSILKNIPFLTRSLGLPTFTLIALIFMIVILIVLNKIMPETYMKSIVEIEHIVNKKHERKEYKSVNVTDENETDAFDKIKLFLQV